MKKNKLMRFASVLVVAVLLSTCAISGTFAKYTSNTSGSDTARVAKWAFTFEDNTTLANTFNFDLFNTTNYTEENVDKDGNGSEVVIAPGTTGSFELNITNSSEVNATYAIDYSIENTSNIPVKFSLDNQDWTDSLADVSATAIAMNGGTATITIYWKWDFGDAYVVTTDTAPQGDTTYYTYAEDSSNYVQADVTGGFTQGTVYYVQKTDATDTALGAWTGDATNAPKITVSANITVTQVD